MTASVSAETLQFHEAAREGDIPAGSGKTVNLGERRIALFHVEAAYYAITDSCPHRGAPLHDGYIQGERVLCSWHCFDFNLKSGDCGLVPGMRVDTWEVKVENGVIYVKC
ncbi:MAG: Rieske (2Fe-2S) protein [Blastocatellia bacterium]